MHRHPRQIGVVAVEVALLLPIFLLLIMGALSVARLLWADAVLDHAARKTARYAMVHGSSAAQPASLERLREEFLAATLGLRPEQLELTVTPEWTDPLDPGTSFRIEARYEFDLWWNALPTVSLPISASATSSVSQ